MQYGYLSINGIFFLLTIIIFLVIAIWGYRRIKSPFDYFHNKEVSSNVISLTAANITIGSGLVYLITGGFQYGYLMLAIPIMTGAGYYLLAYFVQKVVSFDVINGVNFLKGIDDKIAELTGKRSRFGLAVSICLIFVFTLFLGFEIFASSSILTPILLDSPDSSSMIVVSSIVFAVALVYALMSGIKGVFRTDKIQLIAIIVFLGFNCWAIGKHNIESLGMNIIGGDSQPPITIVLVMTIISACLAAIATQFYSIINWTSISHVDLDHQSKMLKWTGLFTAAVLGIIVFSGIMLPRLEGIDPIGQLMSIFSEYSQSGSIAINLLVAVIIVGFLSIIFSTVDSIIISVTFFFYENIYRQNAQNKKSDPAQIRKIRLIGLFCFFVSYLLMMYFNYMRADIFYLLLTIASGVIVFAPMLVAAGYLSSTNNGLAIFGPYTVYGYLFLFFVAFILGFIALHWIPSASPWISSVAFVCSSILSIFVISRSKYVMI